MSTNSQRSYADALSRSNLPATRVKDEQLGEQVMGPGLTTEQPDSQDNEGELRTILVTNEEPGDIGSTYSANTVNSIQLTKEQVQEAVNNYLGIGCDVGSKP